MKLCLKLLAVAVIAVSTYSMTGCSAPSNLQLQECHYLDLVVLLGLRCRSLPQRRNDLQSGLPVAPESRQRHPDAEYGRGRHEHVCRHGHQCASEQCHLDALSHANLERYRYCFPPAPRHLSAKVETPLAPSTQPAATPSTTRCPGRRFIAAPRSCKPTAGYPAGRCPAGRLRSRSIQPIHRW